MLRKRTLPVALVVSALWAFSCGGGGTTQTDAVSDVPSGELTSDLQIADLPHIGDSGDKDESGDDVIQWDNWTGDQQVFDLQPDNQTGLAAFGEPCDSNTDCQDGYCVASDIGFLCTRECIDDCPESWNCVQWSQLLPDIVFLCIPDNAMVCDEVGVCEPDTEEELACGNCGIKTRTCGDNCLWSVWSNCSGEGQCSKGAQEERDCGMCGSQQRTCDEECTWTLWTDCTGEGECQGGESQTQPCSDACGLQTRTCTASCVWSEWGLCQEGVCVPDATMTEPCGNCGTRERLCSSACGWGEWGECLNQGVCAINELESEPCGNCGTKTRTCTQTCQWSAWGACQEEGECAPDDVDTGSCGNCGLRERVCNDQCEFGDWGECHSEGSCTPNAQITEPCGKCGTRQKTCTALCEWSDWGACQGEGVCSLGAVDTGTCGNCGTHQRSCLDTCQWGDWGVCTGEGACSPGTVVPCDNCGTQTCNSLCQWNTCNLGSVDGYEPNDSLTAAYGPWEITDNDNSAIPITANINPAGNQDWFKVHISDISFHSIAPWVSLNGVPTGMVYKLCASYVCDEDGSTSSTSCTNVGSTGGSLSFDVGGCATIWEGDDDSVMLRIQVLPLSNGSCQNYTLQVGG